MVTSHGRTMSICSLEFPGEQGPERHPPHPRRLRFQVRGGPRRQRAEPPLQPEEAESWTGAQESTTGPLLLDAQGHSDQTAQTVLRPCCSPRCGKATPPLFETEALDACSPDADDQPYDEPHAQTDRDDSDLDQEQGDLAVTTSSA